MSEPLPEPLVPPEVDLRDFQFMPLDIARLFNSEFHARSSDAEWRAGVTLWLKSYHQVPAASLPNDDVSLARLAELGRDVKAWRKIRAGALRGWIKCSDGRLYHSVVAEKAMAAWTAKLARRDRTAKAREARLSQKASVHVTDGATKPVTSSKGQGQGQGESPHTPPPSTPSGDSHGSPGLADDNALAPPDKPEGEAPKARASPHGTRLPDGWKPDERDVKFAMDQGLTDQEIEHAAAEFRDFWRGVPGQRGRKLDWPATWRNRVRELAGRRQRAPAGHANGRGRAPAGGLVAAASDLLAEAEGREPGGRWHEPDP